MSASAPARVCPPAKWAVILAFALLYLSWGTTYLAIRIGVESFPPALFGGSRVATAGLILLIYLAIRGEPIPSEPTLEEERQLLLHHFELICKRFGEAKGTLLMRKYACCYAQGRSGAREFRSRVVKISTPAEFREVVETCFPRERDFERTKRFPIPRSSLELSSPARVPGATSRCRE